MATPSPYVHTYWGATAKGGTLINKRLGVINVM